MGIQRKLKNSFKEAQRKSSKSGRERNIARKRVVHACGCKRRRFSKQVDVSDKLEALKSLIPHHRVQNESDGMVKEEELFQETADYIIVLKAQVFVLQKLIEFYDTHNHVQEHQS